MPQTPVQGELITSRFTVDDPCKACKPPVRDVTMVWQWCISDTCWDAFTCPQSTLFRDGNFKTGHELIKGRAEQSTFTTLACVSRWHFFKPHLGAVIIQQGWKLDWSTCESLVLQSRPEYKLWAWTVAGSCPQFVPELQNEFNWAMDMQISDGFKSLQSQCTSLSEAQAGSNAKDSWTSNIRSKWMCPLSRIYTKQWLISRPHLGWMEYCALPTSSSDSHSQRHIILERNVLRCLTVFF